MRSKNLEHASFLKIQQEVLTSINDVGMPALFGNTINDIDKITQQNEFLNYHINVWLMGSMPEANWMDVFTVDISQNSEQIAAGDSFSYDLKHEGIDLRLTIASINHMQPGLITNIQPILTVIIANNPENDDSFENLRLLTDEISWMYVYDFSKVLTPNLSKELSQKLIQFEFTAVDNNTELPSVFSILEATSQEKQSIHQNFSSIHQLKKITKTISLIANRELNSVISKKAVTLQKLQLLPDSRQNNANDIILKTKQLIQQYLSNYEKSTSTSTELFIQSEQHGGIKALLSEIENQEVQFSETPKSKNIELSLDSQFEKSLKQEVLDRVSKKCKTDTQIFIDTLHVLEKEIEQLLESQSVVFQRSNVKYITQNEIDYFINQLIDRKIDYSGTAPNKGMYEYFSAARKFQMVFFMMASVFGVSGLIRKYQFVSIPLSIVLLGYGIINVSKSVAKERLENQEKETKSARESIERWLKDIGSDLNRNWQKTLLDAFKTQINTLASETEAILKTNLVQRNMENEDERKKQQKILQTFETNERKIENINRSVLTMDRNITRVLSDSRSSYNQLLRSERDASRDTSRGSERSSRRSERGSDI